jgi:hypothetical protein
MKSLLLTVIGLFFLTPVLAQIDTIDFEGSLLQIEIDTSYADNIWQIGQPNKAIFDSAYSVPFAMITDTVDYYPTSNQSSFILKVELDGSDRVVSFKHKFDTDSARDGGFVEVSFNQGIDWLHLSANTQEFIDEGNVYQFVETENFYQPNDTIHNGKSAFNGSGGEWANSTITFWCVAFKAPIECHIRFTFSSDTVETNQEGWLIDNITVENGGWCSGIDEYNRGLKMLTISPNPFQDQTQVTVVDGTRIRNGKFTVFDMFGRIVSSRKQINGSRFTYGRQGLQSGIYSYRLTDEEGFSATGKFVVN